MLYKYLTLIMLFILVIGRKGVAYLQLFPGLYFTEILLLIAASQAKINVFIRAMKKPEFFMTVVLFFYGILILLGDLFKAGAITTTALKNFSLVYYPIASMIGYAWGMSNRRWILRGSWISFLSFLFLANGLFSLLYPFSGILGGLVWNVSDGVPILFTYSANTVFLPAGLFFFLLVREVPVSYRMSGVILNITGILLLMERSVFASSLLALVVILSLSRRNESLVVAKYIGGAILSTLVLLAIISPYIESSKVEISFGGYLDLYMSIIFDSDNPMLSGTKSHRLEMWQGLLANISSSNSIFTYLFGKGFNIDIEDVFGITFRAPHNSFLHLLWRTGIVGVILMVSALGLLFQSYFKMLKSYSSVTSRGRYSITLWGLVLLVIMLTDSMFGTLFESPFASAPLFFIVGVCLIYGHSLNFINSAEI